MRSAILISCSLLLCACSAAAPPTATDTTDATDATGAAATQPPPQGLSKAMHDPIDRAKAANAPVEDADKAHDKALEDAGG